MSTDPDINTPCPNAAETLVSVDCSPEIGKSEDGLVARKKSRTVSFPHDDQLVTQYFEPANPWQDVPTTTRAQLAADYLESCRRHNTPPIDSVLQQIREFPEAALGGRERAPRLSLSACVLRGSAPADALEAVLRRVQFRRLEIEHADIDDEGAEAIFDMVEYYESATVLSITGKRHFSIRGWQTASRMIKKSAELSELEIQEGSLEDPHAQVLARSLRPLTCRLRVLCLQQAVLSGEPLHSLVSTLKLNNSVRELRLGDNCLTPADAAQIGCLLRINTRLQLLDLSNNQIQDEGAGHITDALVVQAAQTPPSAVTSPVSPHLCPLTGGYEARGLAFLVLWNNQLTSNCAVHIHKALCSQSLSVLNVGRNAVGAEGVRALCGGGALLSVGLQAARLGPAAAHALADLVRADTKLQRLDLRDNKLGAAGLQAILTALKGNKVLTQIDLDEPSECTSSLCVEDSEAATAARLTREIRALCARRPAPIRRVSLTCRTHAAQSGVEEEKRGRLRSPAPSPAGSPIPAGHSRFSVTRVTPERESSSESCTPPTPRAYCSTPSRFKVVQVSEPPQIQVHPVTSARKNSSSRFSVTRNYDSMYEPVTPPPSPARPVDTPNPRHETTVGPISPPVEPQRSTENQPKVVEVKVETEATIKMDDSCKDNAKSKSDSASDKVSVNVSHTETRVVSASETDETGNIFDFKGVDNVANDKDRAMQQIEAITEDLGNLIQEFKDMTSKSPKVRSDCTQTDIVVSSNIDNFDVPVNIIRENVVLKKNKSESSLDSPDLEVSRLMNKKLTGSPFCDSSSSLEVSGSSVESLNLIDTQTQIVKPIIVPDIVELDRRKPDSVVLSTESSIDSNNSEVTPVNSNLLNMSVSSNESVSPIIFGKSRKIHDSLSSLEASVSSLDSGRQEKVMVTSADSGIEYSLQNPSENKEDNSSNEGTLTNNSSLKETVKKSESLQETVTSPKRTSSLLDVPALKSKGLGDRMRKISWVAPSPSFHIPKPEPEKEIKLNSHLEKLLSLFQHPFNFSRSSNEEEKKSNTPPRKDSSLTSSFWSWGSAEKEREEKEDRDSSSEADSTLSERVQVSFIDESFSKKLDSKTPSTDTDNTLSEFQTFQNSEASEASQDDSKCKVTVSTDDCLVQKLVLSDSASSNGNKQPRTSDTTDLIKPNDLNKNYDLAPAGDNNRNSEADKVEKEKLEEVKDVGRPRSFAAVLKSSGSENSLDKQASPDSGQSVDKLPTKIIRGIKENISPENTLTSSMTNTLAIELTERQVKNQPIVNTVWEVSTPILEKIEPKVDDFKSQSDLAPIATIEEACDESDNIVLDYIDDPKFDEKNASADSGVTLEGFSDDKKFEKAMNALTTDLEQVDLGKDALSYLMFESQGFDKTQLESKPPIGSLAQELQDAEIKEMLDLSPELIIDEAMEVPEVFIAKEIKGLKTSPVIPERAKLKKANSLEELSQENVSPKAKTIAFTVPELSTTTPRDIPERRGRLRTRSGSSPKSLPESLNKPCPLSKMDSILSKKKKKVSSLGKMAKDSLLALNMSEEEIAEFRRSHKLTSVESLRSLESVSEDANSQNSMDYRCRSCLRTSQESLMSLDSITEDCRCREDCDKAGHSNR